MRSIEGLSPAQYDRTLMGVMVKVNGVLRVNVQGNYLPVRWSDPVTAGEGDTVLVVLMIGQKGGTEAMVRGKVAQRARPNSGKVTVVPTSSSTITVVGEDNITYTATFIASYTPVVGDTVYLLWGNNQPIAIGKVAYTPTPTPPPPPPPPPPAPPQTGVAIYAAAETATLWPPGGWNSWAGGNGRVFQGDYGSGQVYGAAWYNYGPTQLKGRAIDRLRFTLGSRLNVGAYNSPVTVHVYLTSNATRPGGDVSLIDGPFDITAWPGQGLADYDLPAWWGAHITNGAGLSFRGNPYAGFKGRNEQPDAFKVILDWRM